MGIIPLTQPQFITGSEVKFHKLMFIKKNGQAIHKLGDISRSTYDAELICISNEDSDNWIGNYAEGHGFFDVKFRKSDCRDASDEEVKLWMKDHESINYITDNEDRKDLTNKEEVVSEIVRMLEHTLEYVEYDLMCNNDPDEKAICRGWKEAIDCIKDTYLK